MSDIAEPVLWAEADGIALGALRADLAHEYWRWESDPGAVLGYEIGRASCRERV